MHASGIRVDDAAKSAFASACSDANALFVQYAIRNEAFSVLRQGGKAGGVEENWAAMRRALEESPNEPSFLLARGVGKESSSGKWLLLFHMPEGSTVRDRMVYASSAGALKDGLGSAHFEAASFNISRPSECSAAEFAAISRSMSQDELLTLDEKAKLEGEAESAKSMSSTRARAIVGLPIQASEESLSVLQSVAKGNPSAVILQLDGNSETLLVQQSGNFSFEQLAGQLPPSEPRYILSNFQHEHEGQTASTFVFVYICPDGIPPKLKMVYSTCKAVVVKLCEQLGITLGRSVELSDSKELSTAWVLDELYPAVQQKKTFKKPARPGRGNARLISSPDSGSAAASSPSPSP